MPIFQAFFLLFLLAVVNGSGETWAQDPMPDNLVPAASHDMPEPAGKEASVESPASPEGELVVPSPDASGLYSPDVLVDMPYIYPLLRMRLTPEMRQGVP